MKLNWRPATDKDEVYVYFPGGFQLYVICRDERLWKKTDKWRVWYGNNYPQIRGLTDVWFSTRVQAQVAAERIFVPMITIAPLLCRAEVRIGAESALKNR